MFIHEKTASFVLTILIYSISTWFMKITRPLFLNSKTRGEFLPKKELLFPIMPFESRFSPGMNPMT